MAGIHRRKRKRETTTDDYAAMLARMLRSYGNRIGQDPQAGLAHLRDLEAELTAAVNVGIYTANRVGGRSINQLADDLGVSKQAVHKRVGLGEQIARQRERASRKRTTLQTPVSPGGRNSPPGGTDLPSGPTTRELPAGSTGD